jgi:adenosylcobinamide-GDP ribazoletransferase
MIRTQVELFFIALGFFTRLPVPGWVEFAPEKLGQAARFLPWVGWIIGLISAAVYGLAVQVLPVDLSMVLAMVASIRATGAFHEDGWADTCDGLGGGWSRAQILAIMKDSRIGSYGTIGLVVMLLAKYLALADLARRGGLSPDRRAAGGPSPVPARGGEPDGRTRLCPCR